MQDRARAWRDPPGAGSLLGFFAAAYALTWACFITVAVAVPYRTPLGQALVLLGAYAPGISAIAFTSRASGAAGVRDLLRPILRWRVGVRWYAFAIGYTGAVKLLAALLLRAITGAWPRIDVSSLALIPFAIAFSTPFQAGEEIGWRGYALPRLAARLGLARASLVLGAIWALWHLPQFYIRGADTYGQSFVVYVVGVVSLSVAFAWLYVQTRSLLLPMLLHAAVNNTKDIVPSATPGGTGVLSFAASPVAWLSVALFGACAVILLVWMIRTRRVRS